MHSGGTTVVTHRYAPKGAPLHLFGCRAPEVLLSGPAGTGKSRACLEKVHATALAVPGMRALIVRKTAVSLSSTGLVTMREHVLPKALQAGVVQWYSGSPQEAACYRYANGSTIVIGGLDKATRIMSSEYDLIYVQEATELTENDWEALTTRLRNGKVSYQQLLADCNPDVPTHWLKKRCDRGQTVMLHCQHEDNPRLFHPDGRPTLEGRSYISKLDALTGVRLQRLRHGQWVAAEGLIYEEWDEAVHVLDNLVIPKEWTRYWAVDFGYTNPFVLQCWAEDHDGRLYLYREIYETGRLVEDHARHILSLVAPGGTWVEPRPAAIVCDHDAEGRATLERILGMGTVAAKKDVTDGIQAVQARLRVQPDGQSRLKILRNSLVRRDTDQSSKSAPCSTLEEIPGYVWSPGKDGRPAKEEPEKQNDHGCDALRYMVAHRDLRAEYRVRWL